MSLDAVYNRDDVANPRESRVQHGFWLYLMSDAVLFALLFATYVVMSNNTAGGPTGAQLFSLPNLSMQTALLLLSTLTIAFCYQNAKAENVKGAVVWLVVSCILGAGFLGLELHELSGMVAADAGPGRSGFLSAFFTLVGTHGLHVTGGVIWGLTMITQLSIEGPTQRVQSRILRLTLFWHFLDIVWIGVFSTVYLPWMLQ